jgi:hypothetical protein
MYLRSIIKFADENDSVDPRDTVIFEKRIKEEITKLKNEKLKDFYSELLTNYVLLRNEEEKLYQAEEYTE